MIHEWHTGNKRMHVWLFQPGQVTVDQYRVSGDAGAVAEIVRNPRVVKPVVVNRLINI